MLLVEQVDRLSRLTARDWAKLCAEIDEKQVRIVALDLPTSWNLAEPTDDLEGVRGSPTPPREGAARAKAAGLYKDRPANIERNAEIARRLRERKTRRTIIKSTGCGRTLLASSPVRSARRTPPKTKRWHPKPINKHVHRVNTLTK